MGKQKKIAGDDVMRKERPYMKIGDRVWLFDGNRRVYDKKFGSLPIYAEHFYQATISGETSKSWIIHYDKFSKKTLQGIYSDEQKADMIWENNNRYKIIEQIRRCPIEILKRIDNILKETPHEV